MSAYDTCRKDPNCCPWCWGSGKIASGEEADPWPVWEELPPGANLAVVLGVVYPIECPKCNGTGRKSANEEGAS